MPVMARRVIVHGRVQGVNFRAATQRAARDRGVMGWLRNRPDGAVEAHLEGEAEAVDGLERWIADGGPPPARVTDLEREDAEPEGATDFDVRG